MKIKEIIQDILDSTVTIKLCENAHWNTSFTPQRRGVQEQKAFSEAIIDGYSEIQPLINKDNKDKADTLFNEFIQGYTKRFVSRLTSKSNCFSVMITGGANFNNNKHQKANDAEQKKSEDLYNFYDWKLEKIKKALRPAPKPTKELLEIAEATHKAYLSLNKIQRNTKLNREDKLKKSLEVTKDIAILKDFVWNIDNKRSFITTSSNAKVKRLKQKLIKEESFNNMENKTQEFDGFKVIFNYEIKRYQIIFEGIPNNGTRDKLKQLGFRWSSKGTAWQVNLSSNGMYKLNTFIKYFKETE